MANVLKVSVLEENGQELGFSSEAFLSIQNIHNENPTSRSLKGVGLSDVLSFIRKNTLYRRNFGSETVEIDSGEVMQLHSPVADGEFIVNGEAYIL